MNQNPMVYVAYDGQRLEFKVVKGVNRALVARAIRKIHDGGDADLVTRGLTEPEVALLLDVVSTLESHRVPVAV